MVLVTPYGPIETARYYHLLLVDPPFAGRVTEWRWAEPAVNTLFFYVLAAIAIVVVWLGRRRLSAFDIAVLVLTFAGGVNAIRGIVWFALACMVFVPVAIGRKLESKNQGEPRRRLNVAITAGLTAALLLVAGSLFLRDESWFKDYWPREPVEAIRAELRPEDRVFAPDRFSDWLLWEIPELRGRISYDVRFELYDEEFFDELQEYAGESTDDWKSFADGYRIVVVDETRRSHTEDFLDEPGARAIYRGDELTVVVRPVTERRRPPTAHGRSQDEHECQDDRGEHRCGLERRPVVGLGRDDDVEREPHEPHRRDPRLDDRDRDEEQREVMQPDDGRERERRGQREDEGARVVATPSEHDHPRQDRDREPPHSTHATLGESPRSTPSAYTV